jgi:alginate O-acetyltransferase complex protein AlgI
VLVTVGSVFFRSPSLTVAAHYLAAMFMLGPQIGGMPPTIVRSTPEIICYLAIGTFFAFAPLDRLSRLRLDRPAVMALHLALASVSLLYSSVLLAASSFNPFIYFRF